MSAITQGTEVPTTESGAIGERQGGEPAPGQPAPLLRETRQKQAMQRK